MVSSTEIEILKKVGFRMPLYTPVYCIEILLAAINFLKLPFNGSIKPIEPREKLFTISMQLLDLAYLKVCKIFLSNSSISLYNPLNVFYFKILFLA